MLTNRRNALTALAGVAASAVLPAQAAQARLSPLQRAQFRYLVPELFEPVARPPSHTRNLVIGSGFGGAVSALRLAQAGETVTVLERGLKWPNAPWRTIFASELFADGRALWFKDQLKTSGMSRGLDLNGAFAGVMDQTDYDNMSVLRAACVGGGSVVFTGVMIQPERRYFDAIFQGQVNFDQMNTVFYPRVRQMLKISPMPADIYRSGAFGHSRVWDEQVRKAGFTPQSADSIFNWSVVRDELQGRSLPSATVGLSNFGNSNGAKYDLNQNYLLQAEATGRAKVYPAHEVQGISHDGSRYVVDVRNLSPEGDTLARYTLTCDRLFLAAGSVGTSELLTQAQALGTLRNLNEEVGLGWGTNGDSVATRSFSAIKGLTQGSPCASRIHDASTGLPVTLENWYAPLVTLDVGVIRSLSMAFDETHRGRFEYDASLGRARLKWSADGNKDAVAVTRQLNNRIADASSSVPGLLGLVSDVSADWTAHPLGGAVLGKALDAFGRVKGHPGLYVMDGAAVPGSTGAVNPSLTIAALAERNIEQILMSGG